MSLHVSPYSRQHLICLLVISILVGVKLQNLNLKTKVSQIILVVYRIVVLSGGWGRDVVLPPRGHLTMSGDVFHCHNWEGTCGM